MKKPLLTRNMGRRPVLSFAHLALFVALSLLVLWTMRAHAAGSMTSRWTAVSPTPGSISRSGINHVRRYCSLASVPEVRPHDQVRGHHLRVLLVPYRPGRRGRRHSGDLGDAAARSAMVEVLGLARAPAQQEPPER